MKNDETIIEVRGLCNFLGGNWVHKNLDLTIKKGELYAIVGGSGSGKTTLLRSLLMLQKPTSGTIKIFGIDVVNASAKDAQHVRHRWGMLFQHGALFSSLTVLENVLFPLKEFTKLSPALLTEIAMMKIALTGLHEDAAYKLPGELSGGMLKRAALSRALALDPELLFLDEPTSGLDPQGADEFDELIKALKEALNLTIVMVSHDLDSLWGVSDKVAFIGEGRVLAEQTMAELIENPNPIIKSYFKGPRGQVRQKRE
ncbi:MAG: ATP-binding cassette domain-containing protein [Gammaproteobacteria bacterium]|nr:ATP-binding cassette domain-containing protein [Gammaproteobacteria bacterium]